MEYYCRAVRLQGANIPCKVDSSDEQHAPESVGPLNEAEPTPGGKDQLEILGMWNYGDLGMVVLSRAGCLPFGGVARGGDYTGSGVSSLVMSTFELPQWSQTTTKARASGFAHST